MDFDDGVLIITDSISVNATVVVWALQYFSVGLKDLRVITQASLLVQIKAKRAYHLEEFSAFQKTEIHKLENVIVSVDDSLRPQVEEIDDLIDEDSLLVAEDPKRPELLQDRNSLIRERNRLYQRRRRARMTEEQKNIEKEKRRQYMQRRRVRPVSPERSLSTSVSHEAKECEQGQFYGQRLQEIHVSEIENDQVIGASEAL